MRVPLLDFSRITAKERQDCEAVFARVLQSGQFVLGPEVQAFEEECAKAIGSKHALAVSSGTDALLLSMMALEIGAGDEVICPSYTFFATAGVIARLGATPVFVDSQPCCYNLKAEDLDREITYRTRAIVPVHLYGQCADMQAIMAVARAHDLAVIEDAAQAIGAEGVLGQAGAVGRVGCFSFYPTKNLSGFGDGGLITTDDEELYERMRIMRVHGAEPKYQHAVVGGNFRMDVLQAALLRLRLPKLQALTEARQENAAYYERALVEAGVAVVQPSVCTGGVWEVGELSAQIGLPVCCAKSHTYNQYVLRVPQVVGRDRMRQVLGEKQIGTEIYYPIPLHRQECFASHGAADVDLPVAEEAARTGLALPIFPGLREEELAYVAEEIAAVMRSARSRMA